MKGAAPGPRGKRRALLAAPSRLIGRVLRPLRGSPGYRAPEPDIVRQNVCDGCEVFVERTHRAVMRDFAASARAATTRDQLLAAWSKVAGPPPQLLEKVYDLAARELRWPRPPAQVPPEPILYVRATTSALERFLGPEP